MFRLVPIAWLLWMNVFDGISTKVEISCYLEYIPSLRIYIPSLSSWKAPLMRHPSSGWVFPKLVPINLFMNRRYGWSVGIDLQWAVLVALMEEMRKKVDHLCYISRNGIMSLFLHQRFHLLKRESSLAFFPTRSGEPTWLVGIHLVGWLWRVPQPQVYVRFSSRATPQTWSHALLFVCWLQAYVR